MGTLLNTLVSNNRVPNRIKDTRKSVCSMSVEMPSHIGHESRRSTTVFELKSRRYIGCKSKIVPVINKIITEKCEGCIDSFCDLFAGTGAVASAFNNEYTQIIANDMLKSSYFSLYTFLRTNDSRTRNIGKKIDRLNSLSPGRENYFSIRYGGTFFSEKNARKIGAIRATIDRIAENRTEKIILVTSLIYAMDRIANTVGHYDAYRSVMDCDRPLVLLPPKLEKRSTNRNNVVLNSDANIVVKNIKPEVMYLDPPYNSRQYCDAYHLLENIALWTKPAVFGKAGKMDRDDMKSKYCTKSAVEAFDDLIANVKAKHIFLSYNNTMGSRHGRSNAKIDDKSIRKILRKKGVLKTFEIPYKEFTAGKTESSQDHAERVFYCKVV